MKQSNRTDAEQEAFAAFFVDAEPQLRRALSAGFGMELGRDATWDALVYGWQHWNRVQSMDNPVGYLFRVGQNLFRVGQNIARRSPRDRAGWTVEESVGVPWIEPGLEPALRALSDRQRTVVAMIHGFGMSFGDVADLLGLTRSSVQSHERRAMKKLKKALGVER